MRELVLSLPETLDEAEIYIDFFLTYVIWIPVLFHVFLLLSCNISLMWEAAAFYVFYYKLRYDIRKPPEHEAWNDMKNTVQNIFVSVARFLHGFEVVGLENLPPQEEGGVILAAYHGPFSLDICYFSSMLMMEKGRTINAVFDNLLLTFMDFLGPFKNAALAAFPIFDGKYESCIEKLKEGSILVVTPGGSREALFSDNNYTVVWGKRAGFAKLALEAKVPIVPMFTENIREAYRWVPLPKNRWLYENLKIPLAIGAFGGLPVKLRTHIGKPIPYDPSLTPQELAQKTAAAVEELIDQNQIFPASMFMAVKQRFVTIKKTKKKYKIKKMK